MIFNANSNQKKAGLAILISDKIDFRSKKYTRGLPWSHSGSEAAC